MQATSPTESDLWTAHLVELRRAVELRKPDALQKLKLEIGKLDNEISAWRIRADIRARAGGDVAAIEARLKDMEARMGDLAGVASGIRAALLDHDHGPTPEQAGKAREVITGDGECTGEYVNSDPGIDDLNGELKRAAMDIRHGWAVITQRVSVAVSGRSGGAGELGDKEALLAEQYMKWVDEMHRTRRSTWAIDDVACEGLSRASSASKRRCDIAKVYALLVAGLELYANAFPPISEVE